MSTNILRIMMFCVVWTFFVCNIVHAGWNAWDNDSGDGQWTTATNWVANRVPTSSDSPIIGSATAPVCTATNGTYTFQYMRVGVENSYPIGTLNVDGADLTCSGGVYTRNGFGYNNGHTGILNLSSGSLTMNNGYAAIIGDNRGKGIVNQTGGVLRFTGGGSQNVTFGTSNGTGEYNFYAGTLEVRSGIELGVSGSATFHVYGYDASSSIQIGGTADDNSGAWEQGAGDTLAFSIDGASSQGGTRINIGLGSDSDNDGSATFADGSILYLDFNSRPKSGTWTVLSAEGGIVDNGLELADGVNSDPDIQWSFEVDGNDLNVTAVVPVQGTVITIE